MTPMQAMAPVQFGQGQGLASLPPELLANPQFLAMLRQQMAGGQAPRMGGGMAMPPPRTMGAASTGAGLLGQAGTLAQFMRPYLAQEGGKFAAGGEQKSPGSADGTAKPPPQGLLGSWWDQMQGGEAKAPAEGGAPATSPSMWSGLLGWFGGGGS